MFELTTVIKKHFRKLQAQTVDAFFPGINEVFLVREVSFGLNSQPSVLQIQYQLIISICVIFFKHFGTHLKDKNFGRLFA